MDIVRPGLDESGFANVRGVARQHSSPFSNVQAISARLWASGFLPGEHAGVALRTKGDPVLFLKDAPGISRELRREMLDGSGRVEPALLRGGGRSEIQTRTQQFEMAFRMQASVPELADLSKESAETYDLYGPDAKTRGSFANSALLAGD
jgi:hypothetical protein